MKGWFDFRAQAKGAEIVIYDEIGAFGIPAKAFLDELKALGPVAELTVRINSPGGSVFDGFAIYNALKRYDAAITVWIDGIAASIASMIAMAGDEVAMPENAMLMLHDPSALVIGTAADMRGMADALDKMKAGMAERATRQLSERVGEREVSAHHGSLAKEQRLEAEQRLKGGALKALVATASLELGIDIGEVDLVCQLGSPRSIASFLQRVGRSGHAVDGMPKGRLFPLSRDDLVVGHDRGLEKMPKEVVYAHYILLLFADRRFCRIVVDKIPTFHLALINESKRHTNARIPLFPFVRNIGQEFIQNKESSLYQEQSVYQSGLFGLERPVTSILFESYAFVEKCAREGESPLEIEYRDLIEFDEVQMEGFTRAALAFLESYLKETKGLSDSQALVRMLNSIESSFTRAYEMDGLEDFRNTKAYGHLDAAAKFIEEAVRLVAQHADKPRTFRTSGELSIGIFDQLARLIVEAIFAASMVSSPVWTSWIVQHNTVWVHVFGHVESAADRIIAFKVRRLLYDEIRELDQFAGFRGARLLGFCLNVLGLQLTDRHRGFRREFYPLQAASVGWIKANYKNLLAEHPEVAEACLQGSISYESDNHRLVKTYSDRTGKQPQREFLYLD